MEKEIEVLWRSWYFWENSKNETSHFLLWSQNPVLISLKYSHFWVRANYSQYHWIFWMSLNQLNCIKCCSFQSFTWTIPNVNVKSFISGLGHETQRETFLLSLRCIGSTGGNWHFYKPKMVGYWQLHMVQPNIITSLSVHNIQVFILM